MSNKLNKMLITCNMVPEAEQIHEADITKMKNLNDSWIGDSRTDFNLHIEGQTYQTPANVVHRYNHQIHDPIEF